MIRKASGLVFKATGKVLRGVWIAFDSIPLSTLLLATWFGGYYLYVDWCYVNPSAKDDPRAEQFARFQESERIAADKLIADQKVTFTAAAMGYFAANKQAILAAAGDGTGAADLCVLDADPATGLGGHVTKSATRRFCSFDHGWLTWKKALPPCFATENFGRSRWLAYVNVSNAGAAGPANGELTVVAPQVLIVPRPSQAASAALAGGVAKNPGQDCGAQAGRQLNVAHFVNTP